MSIDRWAGSANRVVVLGPTRGCGEESIAELLGRHLPQRAVQLSGGTQPSEHDAGGDAVVVVAKFGVTRENDVNVACGDLAAAGFEHIGLVLVEVPQRDAVWAGVQVSEE
jgi:hypothetical protein